MKRCPKCRVTKPLEDFHRASRRGDGRQPYCKECRAEIDHALYERRVGRLVKRGPRPRRTQGENQGAWLSSLKEGRPCTDCGRVYPPEAMQWDHLPGLPKLGDISSLRGAPREEVLAEIAKCELVCANCHAARTYRRSGLYGRLGLSEAAVPHRYAAAD